MAIYNDEKFLRPALDSLLAQDFSDFELIISDNASTDGSQAISSEYAARDPRVRYHRNETNVGATENFNIAFKLSSGEYFMWAGGHDVWAPTYISRCLEVLESDKTIVQCCPIAHHMTQDGKDTGIPLFQIDTRGHGVFVRGNLTAWGAVYLIFSLIRSDALRRTRLLRPVMAPDILLGFELSLLGPFAVVPELLFFMRDHRGDLSKPPSRAQGAAAYLKRLHPAGKSSFGRFGQLKYRIEEMRAVKRAPLSFGQRLALMASVPPSYFMQFYPWVPGPIRRAMRRVMARFFKR